MGLQRVDGSWARMFRGGGIQLVRVGQKEARIDLLGSPLFDITYFRVAFRGLLLATCYSFSPTTIIGEGAGRAGLTTFRTSWA